MISTGLKRILLLAVLLTPFPAFVSAQQPGEADLHRGHFLQTNKGDLAGAIAAFEKVLANENAPKQLQAEAKQRLAQCREDLVARNFARLMPPDALAYFEITAPGEHFTRLAEMMGLIHAPNAAPAPAKSKGIPFGDGAFFPEDFSISPALIAELNKLKGIAFAVTDVDQQTGAHGVMILHPGDSDLIRGLIETAVQFLEPDDPVAEGIKTYKLKREGWLAMTNRLVIVSRSRRHLTDAVTRLYESDTESLANQDDFKVLKGHRDDMLLFAYINGQLAVKRLGSMLRGKEALIARSLLDLDHFKSFSAKLGTIGTGVQAEATLELMEGHHNIAYGLVRTAPFTRRSIKHVPGEIAALAILGKNPAGQAADGDAKPADTQPYLTGMDFGREIFANIEEMALFVLSANKNREALSVFPDIGIVFNVKDSSKSEALWNQLLSLLAICGPSGAEPPREITIEGHAGTEYILPEIGPIVLLRLEESVILAGTKAAVTAAIRASGQGKTIAQDNVFKSWLDSLTPDSSKAILLHVGRALPILSGLAKGNQAKDLMLAASLLNELKISLVTHETPTKLIIRGEVTGLPNIPDTIKRIARFEPRREPREPSKNTPSTTQAVSRTRQ